MNRPIELANTLFQAVVAPGITLAQIHHAVVVDPTRRFAEVQTERQTYWLVYGYDGTSGADHPAGRLLRVRCMEYPHGTTVWEAVPAGPEERRQDGTRSVDA